jgi:hypothetical protein
MNKSQRIYLGTGNTSNVGSDAHIKIRLEQDTDTLEFLSMSIDTKDVYRDFNADYGVLVGRVNANGGVGIPNARVSIFIPLTDEDASDNETYSIYPYKNPRDKNLEGKRYNLLPRVGKKDPITGVVSPKQPFGSFPIKEEVVINEPFLNVYKKYYKYTALTNNSGDYMIFGVPIGTQTIHLSVDITDIGKYSMNPAAMVTNLGYSPNLFTDNNTKIKPSSDLNDLPNIETQEITVDVIPFWGDTINFEIGITRQDFRIRSVLKNTFIIFGSVFTDGSNSMWGENFTSGLEMREMYRIRNDANENIGVKSRRIGQVTEKIYYYPNTITDAQIDGGNVDPTKDMIILSPTEYSSYKRDGDFVFILSCNRNRIMTDENSNEINIDENSSNGVFTKFRGFMTLEITPDDVPMNFTGWLNGSDRGELYPFRYKLKFPQSASRGHSFRSGTDTLSLSDTDAWRKQHYIFTGGSFYSVAKFHGIVYNDVTGEGDQSNSNGFLGGDYINYGTYDPFWNTGVIATSDFGINTGNTVYQMVSNTSNGSLNLFGANWLNLSVHLIQNGYLATHYSRVHSLRTNSNTTPDYRSPYYMNDNVQEIAAGDFNTKWFARSDLHHTDIIEVPQTDINNMYLYPYKGFTKSLLPLTGTEYRNGQTPCPENGGKKNAEPANVADPEIYFYKGFDTANCIQFLKLLGII